MTAPIQIVYSDDLSVPANWAQGPRIPTTQKARAFVTALGWAPGLVYHGLIYELDFNTHAHVKRLLARVHSPAYLKDPVIGWGSLRNVYAQNGVLFRAVTVAQLDGIAFAPCSGFHHAGYDYGWGFCTFNGLAAAAAYLTDTNSTARVLILDGDQHEGDGTIDIIKRCQLDRVINHSITSWDDVPSFEGFTHVIYQAGADAHVLDGGYLNDDTWVKRDELVFEQAKRQNVPITVTFAGGYSSLSKVVDLHLSTYWTASEVFYGAGEEHTEGIRREVASLGQGSTEGAETRPRRVLYGEIAAAHLPRRGADYGGYGSPQRIPAGQDLPVG